MQIDRDTVLEAAAALRRAAEDADSDFWCERYTELVNELKRAVSASFKPESEQEHSSNVK